ncbi:hypothetical protein QZH41_008004 [Actinostola sp. cb2023]|nr:hypothetical protein QZH41_008004 [Actinostola sp. cb2023]
MFIGEILEQEKADELYVNLKINGKDLRFKVDTGAQRNITPFINLHEIDKSTKLMPTSIKLTAYGGGNIQNKGKWKMEITHKENNITTDFYVVDIPGIKPIIGLPTLRELKLISALNLHEINKDNDILERYADVFTGLGLVDGEYHIEIDENAVPVIHASRKIPLGHIPKLKETLDNLESSGIVSKVDRPTDWVNSLIIIEKKDGSLRLCLDPKDLNKAVKREYYNPPTIEAISSNLNGLKVFTVIDMTNCYWHKKLDEESSLLCTFNTPFGRYKFNRLPFGICCASDVAQKMVDEHFADIPGVLAVYDDIMVAVWTDPAKIQAITDLSTPASKEDLQRLLGMVNYLAQYIPNVSEVLAPLRALLRQDVVWSWLPNHDLALDRVKKALTSSPVLRFFDVHKEITLQVDASKSGLSACLLQEGHPVVYASRSLTQAETNYAQIEKELLAIVFGCERFNQFTYGREITIHSDHKPLEAIVKKPLAQSRVQRLLLRLQKYETVVTYVPGTYLNIADTLSRASLSSTSTNEDHGDDDLYDDMEVMIDTQLRYKPSSIKRTIDRAKKNDSRG